MKFSTKKVKKVTKSKGARKQLQAMSGGAKSRSIPVTGVTIKTKPQSTIPLSPLKCFMSSLKPTKSGTIPSGSLVGTIGKPSALAKSMGRIKPLRTQKQCCGKVVRQARQCPTCKTAFSQIPGQAQTARAVSSWFAKAALPGQQKTFVTSPRGATWPGSGKWMTQAELSESTEFMR